ncbi:MAG: GNAT family N-acetyltransferase [Bacteroidales bacterium]
MNNQLERNEIAQLWKLAFGDTDDFIQRYLDIAERKHFLHSMQVDGQLTSFLNLIPLSCSIGDINYQGFYLFGVATDPQVRGLGYSRSLFRDVLAVSHADFIVTVPASQSLFDFYATQGFSAVVSRKWESLPELIFSLDDLHFLPASSDRLLELYQSEKEDRFRWSEDYLRFVLDEYEWMLFQVGGTEYYCVFQIDGARILIQTTNFELNRIAGVFRQKGYLDYEIEMPVFGASDRENPFYALRFCNDEIQKSFIGNLPFTLAMDS